jgi:hypothetical protein
LGSAVRVFALEDGARFVVNQVTCCYDGGCEAGVRSDEGDAGLVDLGEVRDGPVAFVEHGLRTVENVPGGMEIDVLVHAGT